GYFADTGGSFPVPPVPPKAQAVCDAARRALTAAMQRARAGQPLRVIGAAIEAEARRSRLKVIRNLCSHGIGRKLHDEPGMIPGYADPRDRRVLTENLVITIEPFLSTGATWVEEAEDGWTLRSQPGHWHAQYEHTLVITQGEPVVLTA
ncbi:MAG TPA: M24 family metallopeptidase, partial [bacterium]